MTNNKKYRATPIGSEMCRLLARTIRDGVETTAPPTGDLVYEHLYKDGVAEKVYIDDDNTIIHYEGAETYILNKASTVYFLKNVLKRRKRSKETLRDGEIIHWPMPRKKRRGTAC